MDDFIDSRITLAIFIHAICKSVECDGKILPTIMDFSFNTWVRDSLLNKWSKSWSQTKTQDRSTINVNQRWSGKGRKGSKAQIFEERDNRRTQTQKPQLSQTGADRLWVLCEIRQQQKKLQCPHLRKRVKLYSSPFTDDTKKLNWALFFQWWLAGQDIFHQVPTRWH